jgi:hypothetical protein
MAGMLQGLMANSGMIGAHLNDPRMQLECVLPGHLAVRRVSLYNDRHAVWELMANPGMIGAHLNDACSW